MGISSLTEKFRDKACAARSAATLTASALALVGTLGVTATPADAQTPPPPTNYDVNAMVGIANGAPVTESAVVSATRFINSHDRTHDQISPEDGSAATALYVNFDRFLLEYPAQGYARSEVSIADDAQFLAQSLGLQSTEQYRHLDYIVDLYSGIAQAFATTMQQPMSLNDSSDLDGTKFQAIIDLQLRAAEFLEMVADEFVVPRPDTTPEQYAAYGRLCHFVQTQGQTIQNLYEEVSRDHGRTPFTPRHDPSAMTAELPNGQPVVCPPRR